MKISFFLLFAGIAQLWAVNVTGQDAVIHISEKLSVGQFLNEIEKQTNYLVIFSNREVDTQREVDIPSGSATVSEYLKDIFAGTEVRYEFENDYIILSQRPAVSFPQLLKQQITVTGTVTDESGEPVPGVNVLLKGSLTGTVTNIDGKYSFNVPDNQSVLIFSFIGYTTQEFQVGDQQIIDVNLKEDTHQIEEVVVIGYGSQKKANLTGAISSVKMDDVLGSRPVTSTAQALNGTIPGLSVTAQSGEPGIAANLNIRGFGQISKNDDNSAYSAKNPSPLILVDNVPIDDLSMINPNDIENVTVLKDAAASAIHGARAAFGVILITTKKGGKEQKPRINYSNNFTFSAPLQLAKKATMQQNIQAWTDAGRTASPAGGGQELAIWKPLLEDYATDPSLFPLGYQVVDGVRYDLAENDAYKELLDNSGFQQSHNLSVSGGSQKSTYRMSFGYTNEDGIIVTNKDSYTRYNAAINASTDITKWLNTNAEAIYSRSSKTMPNGNLNGGFWGKASSTLPVTPAGYSDYATPGEMLPVVTPANLVRVGDMNTNRKDELRLVGRVTASPFDGFRVVAEFTYYNNRLKYTDFDKKVKMVDADKWNTAYTTTSGSSKFTKRDDLTDHNALNIYATYQKEFKGHNFSVMGGFNQEYDYYERLDASNTDMINEALPSIKQGTGTISADDKYQEYAVRGAFYRLNYDYKGKYLFEMNGRYDGSSKFPKNDRFGFFPSFSAGWRISEELFMQSLKPVMSNLKLRASWGNIGNQGINPYSYISEMDAGYARWADGSGTRYRALGAPGLISNGFTWERVQTLDFGMDVSFLNYRLNAVFDWYSRKTIGMLAPGMDLPAVVGASAPRENSADLITKGWEFEINWKDKIGAVSYHIGFNIYDSQSEITRFDDNDTKLLANNNLYVGRKIGEIWGLTTDRYYTENDFEDYSTGKLKDGIPAVKGQSRHFAGDVLYQNLDDDNEIISGIDKGQTADNPGDYRVIGNSTPRYNYGINGGVSWNNFDFNFLLQGVGKRDIWWDTNERTVPFGASEFNCLYDNMLDYWTPENPDAFYARFYNASGSYTSYNYHTQTKYLKNGAFLRIKNITLGYSLPKSLLEKVNIERLRIFVSGENLYTFKHTPDGMEPDLTAKTSGIQYPYMRMFSMGLNLTF